MVWKPQLSPGSLHTDAGMDIGCLKRMSPKKGYLAVSQPGWVIQCSLLDDPTLSSVSHFTLTCTSRVRASSSSWPKCWPSMLRVSLTQAFIDFRTCSFSTWRHLGGRTAEWATRRSAWLITAVARVNLDLLKGMVCGRCSSKRIRDGICQLGLFPGFLL